MKIFSMMITLGIMLAVPLIYMGKLDPMGLFDSGFSMGSSELSKLKAKAPKNLSNVVTDEKVQIYKWRDEKGIMQFSNTPPPTGGNAERVELDPNSNLMQAVKVPEKEEEKEVVQTKPPNPYSPSGMQKTMEDVRGVEDMLNKRHEKQQKALNNI